MVFFRGRKLSRISHFCGDSRIFSTRKSTFKQLDTVLVGVVHWVTANSLKFSPRKCIFKQFSKVFSRERNPLHGMLSAQGPVRRVGGIYSWLGYSTSALERGLVGSESRTTIPKVSHTWLHPLSCNSCNCLRDITLTWQPPYTVKMCTALQQTPCALCLCRYLVTVQTVLQGPRVYVHTL